MNAVVNDATLSPRPTFSPTLVQPPGVPETMSLACDRKLPWAIANAHCAAAPDIEPLSVSGPNPRAERWAFKLDKKPASIPVSRTGAAWPSATVGVTTASAASKNAALNRIIDFWNGRVIGLVRVGEVARLVSESLHPPGAPTGHLGHAA